VRRATPALVLLAVLGAPETALAYEDQIGFGLGLGYAHAVSDTAPAHGALGELSVSLGLSEAWTLRGRGGYALHPADRPMHVVHGAADLLYVVDVIEIVPYGGLGVGGLGMARAGAFRAEPEAHLVLGADYLLSRTLAFELDTRGVVLPAALDTDPLRISVVLGLVWLFDD